MLRNYTYLVFSAIGGKVKLRMVDTTTPKKNNPPYTNLKDINPYIFIEIYLYLYSIYY